MTPAELRSRRKALGLTQDALAVRLGVTSTSVARWERGRHPIPLPVVIILALLEAAGIDTKTRGVACHD